MIFGGDSKESVHFRITYVLEEKQGGMGPKALSKNPGKQQPENELSAEEENQYRMSKKTQWMCMLKVRGNTCV